MNELMLESACLAFLEEVGKQGREDEWFTLSEIQDILCYDVPFEKLENDFADDNFILQLAESMVADGILKKYDMSDDTSSQAILNLEEDETVFFEIVPDYVFAVGTEVVEKPVCPQCR